MAVAGSLVIEMAANVARLATDFDKARATVGRQVGKIRADVGSAMRGVEAIIAGAGVAGLARLVIGALEAGDEIQKMAKRTGLAAGELQELGHAARMSGVSMETFESGVTRLNRNLAEAAAGSQQAIRTFADLGVSVRDAEGRTRSAGAVLGDIAERFKTLRDPAERARLAFEAFGRGAGTQMIPLLEEGAEGLARLREEARRLGLVLDESMVQEAERAKDSVERMEAVVKTAFTRMVVASAPAIERIVTMWTEGFADLAKAAERFLPARFQSLEGLRAELGRVDAQIRRVQESMGQAPLIGHLIGADMAAELEALAKTRNELARLIQARLALAAVAQKPLPSLGPSAEQLAAIDKLRQKVIDAAIPDATAQSIVRFRHEIEELAAKVPARAEEIRALGAAFEDVKTAAETTKQAITDTQAAAAAKALGVDASAFEGFEEIRKLASEVDVFSRGIKNLAASVPGKDLFGAIEQGARGLDARMADLEQRFADQPAVLARMKSELGALQFGGLARDLDTTVRELGRVQAGTVSVAATADALEESWIPALRRGGAAVQDMGAAALMSARGIAALSEPVVRVTGDVNALAQAFAFARIQAFLLGAETGGTIGGGIP